MNTQAQLYFAQDNPDTEDNAKVFKLEKVVPDGFDNWGGWAHIIFGLGNTIAEETISALPQWDNDNDGVESKGGAVDITIEDTLFSWSVREDNLCTLWKI